MTSSQTATIDARIDQVVSGRYKITARIGEGGMGTVYRAEHLELGRPVAIKLLIPELARNRTAVERFLREARTASAIGHPNIVDVFDLGRDTDGVPYLAMELFEGRDLADVIDDDAPLSLARVIEILAPIANALDVCHERGVIHRDLKPSNVFIAELLDGTKAPKLVDFGLATLYASDERLTRTGFIAGTPEYMPPEAAHGELAGPAGDIYALATIAFEAICGEVPFTADLPNGILIQKVTTDPPRMSHCVERSFPEELEQALALGLAMKPEDRPSSAKVFVDSLRAAQAGIAPEAPSVSQRDDASPAPPRSVSGERTIDEPEVSGLPGARPLHRSPLVWSAAAVFVLLLAPLAFWALGSTDSSTDAPPPDTSESPSTSASQTEDSDPASTEVVAEADAGTVAEPLAVVEPSTDTGAEGDGAPANEPRGRRRSTPTPPSEDPDVATPEDEGSTAPAPDRAEAERLVRSAASLLIRDDHAGALRLLDRARSADASYPDTYRTIGLAHERAGRASAARSAYQRYLRMAPGAGDAGRIRQRLEAL